MSISSDQILHLIRRYPATSLLVLVIWVVCLIPIPETPLSNVSFIDKWTHFLMYAVLFIVCAAETCRYTRPNMLLLFVLASLMGGLVELAQAYLTTCRSGEWLDFFADAVGALIGAALFSLFLRLRRR